MRRVSWSCTRRNFKSPSDDDNVKNKIFGKRKQEVGLVVLKKYNDFMAKRQTANILDAEISKCKELLVSLEFYLISIFCVK